MEPSIRTGFAIRDITAPVGADMPGHFDRRLNKGVLDALLVTAAVLDDGVQAVALVGVDALFITGDLARSAFGLIESRTNLRRGQVLIGASHTRRRFEGLYAGWTSVWPAPRPDPVGAWPH